MINKAEFLLLLSNQFKDKEYFLHSENISDTFALGMNIKQNTITESIYLFDQSFSQTSSTSSFFSSSIRVYSDKNGNIIEYKGKNNEEMKINPPIEYTPSDYIKKYGKLVSPFYEEIDEKTKETKPQIGLFLEEINSCSISSYDVKDKEITLILDTKKALEKLSLSIKNNGDFDSLPVYSQAKMTFFLNDEDQIYSWKEDISYKIKWGFVQLKIHQQTKSDIYPINTKKILVSNKEEEIHIPDKNNDYSFILQ